MKADEVLTRKAMCRQITRAKDAAPPRESQHLFGLRFRHLLQNIGINIYLPMFCNIPDAFRQEARTRAAPASSRPAAR